MALRSLVLKNELDAVKRALDAVVDVAKEHQTRSAELETALTEMSESSTQEERDAIAEQVEKLEADKAETEKAKADLEAEIERINAELADEERAAKEIEITENRDKEVPKMETNEVKAQERAAFADYVRGIKTRDDYNMTQGNNGAVVPKTIANEIITKVSEICPIYEMATKYAVKGTLEIPYYPASTSHVIAAAYTDDFGSLTASVGDLSAVELTGYTAAALAKIGKKLINNTDIDVVPFIVNQMAEAFRSFYEKELLVGTNNKVTGLLAGITSEKTATYKSSVTADDLIGLQCAVPTALQAGCRWLMKPATFEVVRKLKDDDGRYLLAPDYREGFGYTLLGKPVDLSDNMPALGTAGNKAIVYGDYSGLAVKVAEELEVQVLYEQFATQHAVGVVGWTEIDAKVANAQKFAVLKCGSADPQ